VQINPKIIYGDFHKDARGIVTFFNHFIMDSVKRMYIIEPSDKYDIRAWQGHRYERKWFYPLVGNFDVRLIKPLNWDNPNKVSETFKFTLESNSNEILHIPGGFINGFRGLDSGAKLMVFSNLSLDDSKIDDIRFPTELWNFE